MIYKIRLKNFEIIDYEDPISKRIIETCKKSYGMNKKFFGQDTYFFRIIICNSEKRFKKEMKKLYAAWAKGGAVSNSKIVVRGPKEIIKCYIKYKGTKSLEKMLTHEICHIFMLNYPERFNTVKGPIWLFEGMATIVEDRKRKFPQIPKDFRFMEKNIFSYRRNKKKTDKFFTILYPFRYFLTKYLIDKYGKEKLLILIGTFAKKMKKADYLRNFQRIYGKKEKEMIKEFLKS